MNHPNPNRTRDHQANERTFLAWIRTAIALFGFGVLIVKLRYFVPAAATQRHGGWELGLAFAVVGLLLVAVATGSYFVNRRTIEADSYEPQSRLILVTSFVVLLLGAATLFYLSASPPISTPDTSFLRSPN